MSESDPSRPEDPLGRFKDDSLRFRAFCVQSVCRLLRTAMVCAAIVICVLWGHPTDALMSVLAGIIRWIRP